MDKATDATTDDDYRISNHDNILNAQKHGQSGMALLSCPLHNISKRRRLSQSAAHTASGRRGFCKGAWRLG